jgi:hypothetical protein
MPRRSRAALDQATRVESSRPRSVCAELFEETFARVVVERVTASGASKVKSARIIRLNMSIL